MDSVQKKITFWKLGFIIDSTIHDPDEMMEDVCCLPYAEGGRLYQREDNTGIAIWKLNSQKPFFYRFGTQRTNEIPDEVDHVTGDVSPLPIDQNKSILESAFLILFKDGIVGFSTGMYAPRASQLREYFFKVLGDKIDDVMLEPLAREDIDNLTEEIAQSWIKKMTIRYYRQAAHVMKAYDEKMAETLNNINAVDPECTENTVSWGDGRTGLKNGLLARLISQLAPMVKDEEMRVHLIDLTISYYNPETKSSQSVNLLERFIVTKKMVLKIHGKRNVDPDDMNKCIQDAYTESVDDIEKANTLVIHTWLDKKPEE